MAKANLNVVSETQFKIETNVPPPATRENRAIRYPFKEMEVGHSFVLTKDQKDQVRSAASYYGSRNSRLYSVRKDGNGYRCWRVA